MTSSAHNSALTADLLTDQHFPQSLMGDDVNIMDGHMHSNDVTPLLDGSNHQSIMASIEQVQDHAAMGEEHGEINSTTHTEGAHTAPHSMQLQDGMQHQGSVGHDAGSHDSGMTGHGVDHSETLHNSGGSGHTPQLHDPLIHAEHTRLLNLITYPDTNTQGDGYFVAINDGSWFDPNTWEHGEIPTDDGKVFISEGVNVTYDDESDARLYTLRVDGSLEFAKDQDTKLLVDTFVVSNTGRLEIGTEDDSVHADVQTQIIFTSDTAIDTSWDTTQLSRGLVSNGEVSIHGAEKLEFASLVGNARAGETFLDLREAPTGWRVGDKIVLGGTHYSGNGSDEDNSRFHDEELTIERIVGNRVFFSNDDTGLNRLRYNHTVPAGQEAHDLKLYVANLSRNVSFSTENGEDAPIGHRGHIMFMHNPNVVVEHTGFYDLGRTNKLELIDAVGTNIDGSAGNGENVRGRYAVHFHRTGSEGWEGQPAIARGIAISGSPGWGLVHHDSYAIFEDNVVFDVVGSGIAAEAGNEIGAWRNNLTIKTIGNGDNIVRPDLNERNVLHDFGYEGEGYWVQGAAQIVMVDNKAVSAAGGGINIFSNAIGGRDFREASNISVDVLSPEIQEIARAAGLTEVDVANVPLLQLSGFETYNSTTGIFFWQHLGNNDGQLGFNGPGLSPAHELRSRVDNFKIWNVIRDGVHFQYSTQIDLENGLILGNPTRISGKGISSNRPSQNLTFRDLHIEGFREGFYVPREGDIGDSTPLLGSRIENSTFVNNRTHLSKRFSRERAPNRTDLFPDYFEIINTTFSEQDNNTAPVAAFESSVEGGLGLSFDASGSFDPDVAASQGESSLAIAAYGWDFDGDGSIDKFGRTASHKFETAGVKNVSLTVWDTQGASQTLRQTINVTPSNYVDAVTDGSFTDTTQESITVRSKYQSSLGINLGWTSNGWEIDQAIGNGGAAVAVDPRRAIGQVIYDDFIRTGQQTLSVDFRNVEGDSRANEITARIWGVNGQFRHRGWQASGPTSIDTLPMESTLLIEESVGGVNFDWTTFQWNADFQEGYEFLIFQVDADGFTRDTQDYIAVDNFRVSYDGSTPVLPNLGEEIQPEEPTDNPDSASGGSTNPGLDNSSSPRPREAVVLNGTMADDTLSGGAGNDRLNGRGNNDRLQGHGGNDRLIGAGGDDILLGSAGNDQLIGSNGDDRLFGHNGRDTLVGGNNDDRLRAGKHDDLLLGGRGTDTLEGGAGRDRFRWTKVEELGDTILDFNSTEDRLQFKASALGSDLNRGIIDASQLTIGGHGFSAETRFIYENSQLFYDEDGNGSQQRIFLASFVNGAEISSNAIQII